MKSVNILCYYRFDEAPFAHSPQYFVSDVRFHIWQIVVKNLLNGTLSRGNHTVIWNASNMPGGVYFYKLVTDEFNVTKKIVLLR